MSQRFVLGLDLGGGAIRALLIDVETRALSLSARPWLFTPAAEGALMALDFDPEETWRDVGEVVRDVMPAYRDESNDVVAQNLEVRTPCRHVVFVLCICWIGSHDCHIVCFVVVVDSQHR